MKGDFRYEDCASFCQESKATSHCRCHPLPPCMCVRYLTHATAATAAAAAAAPAANYNGRPFTCAFALACIVSNASSELRSAPTFPRPSLGPCARSRRYCKCRSCQFCFAMPWVQLGAEIDFRNGARAGIEPPWIHPRAHMRAYITCDASVCRMHTSSAHTHDAHACLHICTRTHISMQAANRGRRPSRAPSCRARPRERRERLQERRRGRRPRLTKQKTLPAPPAPPEPLPFLADESDDQEYFEWHIFHAYTARTLLLNAYESHRLRLAAWAVGSRHAPCRQRVHGTGSGFWASL